MSYDQLRTNQINAGDFCNVAKLIGYDVAIGNHGVYIQAYISRFDSRDHASVELEQDIYGLMHHLSARA
ncbi:MAG TPA: hypothetical protein PKV92_09145 [Thermodesulfovibrio thiophilus]|nr:hypothetical protein [Thermodesulfovibrio thiophilus]